MIGRGPAGAELGGEAAEGGSTVVSTADAGVLDTLHFHRRQLERQRDFRRHSWRWQFLAISPGLVSAVRPVATLRPSRRTV